MRKLLFVALGILISSAVMSQDLNPLFQKHRLSINFFPAVSYAYNNTWGFGLTTGVGYNLFDKTEIGLNLSYSHFTTNFYKTNLYVKYYFLKGRFSPFIEFDNNYSNLYEMNKWLYKPAIGFGLGYYAFKNRLAIEIGLFHAFFNTQNPQFLSPSINLKWYFK